MTSIAQAKQHRLKKLDPRAWIGYLIGYLSYNIYRIWIPILGKVVYIRDVIFNEAETFDGDLRYLKDDVREMDLGALQKISLCLRKYTSTLKGPRAKTYR